MPSTGSRGRGAVRVVFSVASLALRVLACVSAVLVVVMSFASSVGKLAVLFDVTNALVRLLPKVLQGAFVFETPFGGAFRGDLAIAACVLFALDWLCTKVAHRLT